MGLGLFDPRQFNRTWPEPSDNPNRPYVVGLSGGLAGWHERDGMPWTSDARYMGDYVTAVDNIGFDGLGDTAIQDAASAQRVTLHQQANLISWVRDPATCNVWGKFQVGDAIYRVPVGLIPPAVLESRIDGVLMRDAIAAVRQRCTDEVMQAEGRMVAHTEVESARQDAISDQHGEVRPRRKKPVAAPAPAAFDLPAVKLPTFKLNMGKASGSRRPGINAPSVVASRAVGLRPTPPAAAPKSNALAWGIGIAAVLGVGVLVMLQKKPSVVGV